MSTTSEQAQPQGGRGKWYSGKVAKRHPDDSYDILYDDGDSEKRVHGSKVRKLPSASPKRQKREGGEGGADSRSATRVGRRLRQLRLRLAARRRWGLALRERDRAAGDPDGDAGCQSPEQADRKW